MHSVEEKSGNGFGTTAIMENQKSQRPGRLTSIKEDKNRVYERKSRVLSLAATPAITFVK